jgi:hypothetical protein
MFTIIALFKILVSQFSSMFCASFNLFPTYQVTPNKNWIRFLWVANLLFRSFVCADFFTVYFYENRENNELLLFRFVSVVAEFVEYLKKTENLK